MTWGYSRYQVNVWRGIVCLSSKSADQDCQNGEERDCDKGNLAQPLQQQAVEIHQDTQHEGDVPNLSATKAHNMLLACYFIFFGHIINIKRRDLQGPCRLAVHVSGASNAGTGC